MTHVDPGVQSTYDTWKEHTSPHLPGPHPEPDVALHPKPSLDPSHEFQHAHVPPGFSWSNPVERCMAFLGRVRTPDTWLTMEEISEWDAAPPRKWSTSEYTMMTAMFASWRGSSTYHIMRSADDHTFGLGFCVRADEYDDVD
jgi:hypothetical protein